jgi:hypothetical protein
VFAPSGVRLGDESAQASVASENPPCPEPLSRWTISQIHFGEEQLTNHSVFRGTGSFAIQRRGAVF